MLRSWLDNHNSQRHSRCTTITNTPIHPYPHHRFIAIHYSSSDKCHPNSNCAIYRRDEASNILCGTFKYHGTSPRRHVIIIVARHLHPCQKPWVFRRWTPSVFSIVPAATIPRQRRRQHHQWFGAEASIRSNNNGTPKGCWYPCWSRTSHHCLLLRSWHMWLTVVQRTTARFKILTTTSSPNELPDFAPTHLQIRMT